MNDQLWQQILVAAVGPVLTAGLALLVINWITAWAQQRRDSAETRESLASSITESGNTLYFGLQSFWRTAKDVPLASRRTDPGLGKARQKLDDLYQTHRVIGKVLEQRLKIYYRDPSPARNWHAAMALLSTRNFLLLEGDTEARARIRRRNAGPDESGLSDEDLKNPDLIMSAYRQKLVETIQSIYRYKVDRRGKHLHNLDMEFPETYPEVGD